MIGAEASARSAPSPLPSFYVGGTCSLRKFPPRLFLTVPDIGDLRSKSCVIWDLRVQCRPPFSSVVPTRFLSRYLPDFFFGCVFGRRHFRPCNHLLTAQIPFFSFGVFPRFFSFMAFFFDCTRALLCQPIGSSRAVAHLPGAFPLLRPFFFFSLVDLDDHRRLRRASAVNSNHQADESSSVPLCSFVHSL